MKVIDNPAIKHVHSAVRHARLKGIKTASLNNALIHYGLVGTYDLTDQDANLMAQSVLAYAASLIVRREQANGCDVSKLNLDDMNRALDHPPFLETPR